MYEIRFTRAAENYFKKIKEKSLKNAFKSALKKISADPFIGKQKAGDLKGLYSFDVYYSKTNYEMAYKIYNDDEKIVVIILAGTRENFYDEIKKYLK